MAITIDGSSGITFPAGGTGNTTGTAVGTTDTQTLTNKTLTTPVVSTISNSGTVTIPTGTNTLNVVGPAFSAYQSGSQGNIAASTWTKLIFQTEDYDTGNAFDNAANYRFQPSVAGYYIINGSFSVSGTISSCTCAIYRNGGVLKRGNYNPASSLTNPMATVSSVVYLNGSTDYLEIYGFTGTLAPPNATQELTYFNGCFLRA